MEKNQKMAGADLLASIFYIALGIWVFVYSSNMKVFRTLIISPGLFPMILGGIFVLCGLVLMIMALKRGGVADCKRLLSGTNIGSSLRSPTFRRGLTVLLMIFVYVCLLGNSYLAKCNFVLDLGDRILPVNVGFIAITAGYLFATFIYLKAMRIRNAVALSLATAVIVYYAFNQGFGIPIP